MPSDATFASIHVLHFYIPPPQVASLLNLRSGCFQCNEDVMMALPLLLLEA